MVNTKLSIQILLRPGILEDREVIRMKKIIIASLLFCALVGVFTLTNSSLIVGQKSNEIKGLQLTGMDVSELNNSGVFPDETGFALRDTLKAFTDDQLRKAIFIPRAQNDNATLHVIGSGIYKEPYLDEKTGVISFDKEGIPVIIIYVTGLVQSPSGSNKEIDSNGLIIVSEDGETLKTIVISAEHFEFVGTPIRTLSLNNKN